MRFSINLSTRLHYNRRGLKLLLWGLTGFISLFIFIVTVRIVLQKLENTKLLSEITKFDQQLGGQSADVAQKDFKSQKELITSINTILERRAANKWIAMLDALESVVPDGVALSRLEPDRKDNMLKLEGMAKNFNSIRKLLENLDNSTSFKEPLLISHTEMVISDRVQGLQFSISVRMVLP